MAAEGDAHSQKYDKTVLDLTNGLLLVYEKPLVDMQRSLKELTDKQEVLIIETLVERRRLDDASNSADTIALIADLTRCRERLLNISKMMTAIHKRTSSLRARALNVEKLCLIKAARAPLNITPPFR